MCKGRSAQHCDWDKCFIYYMCAGYGFVDFESPLDAMKAVHGLQAAGILAQFAKVPQV